MKVETKKQLQTIVKNLNNAFYELQGLVDDEPEAAQIENAYDVLGDVISYLEDLID